MRYILALTAAMLLSCGSPQQAGDTIRAVNDTVWAACVVSAGCLPEASRGGLTPAEYCDKLTALGTIFEFIARHQTCEKK